MADSKQDIVDMLRELAELTMLDEGDPQSFRVRAYESAAQAIKDKPAALARTSKEGGDRRRGAGPGGGGRPGRPA